MDSPDDEMFTDLKFEVGSLYKWPKKARAKAARPRLTTLQCELLYCIGPIMFLESEAQKYTGMVSHSLSLNKRTFPFETHGWKVLYKDSVYILEDYYFKLLRDNNVFLEKIC